MWDPGPVDGARRRQLAQDALRGYAHGTDAPLVATAAALARADSARAVILVEGVSDQIALESLADRRGLDLTAEGRVIVPIGGAQAIGRYLERFGPPGRDLPLSGLCDAGEELFFRRGLARVGLGMPQDRRALERRGFFVCVDDLEDELARAAGSEMVEGLLESQGDLGSFRTLQKQPQWKGRPFPAQFHRWLRAGSRRNLRYAGLLTRSIDSGRMPYPLDSLLAHRGRG